MKDVVHRYCVHTLRAMFSVRGAKGPAPAMQMRLDSAQVFQQFHLIVFVSTLRSYTASQQAMIPGLHYCQMCVSVPAADL